MRLKQFLTRILGQPPVPVQRPVLDELKALADERHREQEAVAAELLSVAVHRRHSREFQLRSWRAMSRREREVTALCCLGYKNSEIAERLAISRLAVSVYIRNITRKFGIQGKLELREFFSALNFRGWEEETQNED